MSEYDDQRKDISSIYNRITLKQLQKMAPSVSTHTHTLACIKNTCLYNCINVNIFYQNFTLFLNITMKCDLHTNETHVFFFSQQYSFDPVQLLVRCDLFSGKDVTCLLLNGRQWRKMLFDPE